MIDIGVNLTSVRFQNDIDDVIENALQAGIESMIVTGTNVEKSRLAQQLTMQYPDCLYSTAGIHPHDASLYTQESLEQLTALLEMHRVVAVGECGLDYNRNFSTRAEQLSCFEAQLELAVELKLPVFLHQREAHNDLVHLIKKYRSGLVGGVAHCFTGGQAELESYLDLDLSIGITGWLCDERRGKELQDCVALIPDDKIMVETDAPYLFPRDLKLATDESLSGKKKKKNRSRNEPQYLPHITKTLEKYMHKDELVLTRLTIANSKKFFRL
ncbi:MAG: TatD family hydrolase [gamma proteobacterium symbiont of Taylorina sp.]|nr:TatD family hydrolase [gamma proteobacterium symbiont of Taylorina sp.]